MRRKKTSVNQRDKFIKAATENEADLDKLGFEQVIQQIAKQQPDKPKNDKGKRGNHTE